MRVLMLSMDARVNERGTLVVERLAALAKQVGEIVALAPDGKGKKARQLVRLWRRASALLRGRTFSAKGGPASGWDLITVQDTAYLALLALLLARRFGLPLEVQVHGFEKMRGVRKILAGFVLRRADKVRVVSERMKKELKARFKIIDSKIYVLPVYAQITTPTPLAPRGVLPLGKGGEATFTFLTVGRLVPVKNIALQIRALARIAKEFPQARLRIVGGGPEQENLPYIADALSLNESVIFEGEQKEVGAFYQSADAFLLSSDAEGWGVAVVEAAAYGLPIVMTDVGCAGEFIRNGENGIVVPVGDERAFASAMARLMQDGGLRARLGRAARAAFFALPSRDECIQKQIAEWRSVIMK